MSDQTKNYGFVMPAFNGPTTWHDDINNNLKVIDAAIYNFVGLTANKGAWANGTAYAVSDRAFDIVTYEIYQCLVGHVSAATGTFAAHRTANPTHWVLISLATPTYMLKSVYDPTNKAADVFAMGNMAEGADAKVMTAAERAKLGFVTVTQAVNLDTMESDIAALTNGMVYKGTWDASAGTFPGAGAAQIGWFYYVSVGGTVDGVVFDIGDNIVAIAEPASATTYAGNWSKHDQTDAVTSVAGRIGAVVLVQADIGGLTTADSPQLAGINLGHATDTTVDRAAAGFIQVEGNRVPSPAAQVHGDVLARGATEWERIAAGTADFFLMAQGAGALPVFAFPRMAALHYVAGNWYWAAPLSTNTTVVAANRLYAHPFFVGRTATFDRIALEVTTAAAGNARLGIYNHDFTTGLPGTLVADLGTVDTSAIAVLELTISQLLTTGAYWLVAVFDATPTVRRYGGDISLAQFYSFGTDTSSGASSTNMRNSATVAFTYAALPATFPAGATRVSDTGDAIKLGLRAV